MHPPASPAASRRRAELLRLASRTFAVGIERLPPHLREPIQTAYLLLRVSDYLEDSEALPSDRKIHLLTLWADVLADQQSAAGFRTALGSVDESTPDASVAREFELVLAALESLPTAPNSIVRRHVEDTTRGMAYWLERGPDFEGEADLDDYMHEVAGRVGWLLTELFVLESERLMAERSGLMDLGRSFGLGLQTVNVIRGLHQDHERGWLYVPRSYLRDAGLSGGELFDHRHEGGALVVLQRLTEKADRHLSDALRYTTTLPRRLHGVRVFCALPLFFAVRTLTLSRGNARVFDREVKMTRAEVTSLVARTRALAWSNAWIRSVAGRLSRPE
ncbi:MAG: squalene/phytoene synthase family protein [Gemmatimonadota bacterium]